MTVTDIILHKAVPAAGTLLSFLMYAAPGRSVVGARARGALGDLNPLPLVLTLANAAGWTFYSLATTPADPYIFAANLFGSLLGLWYTITAATLAGPAVADRLTLTCVLSAALFGGAGAAQQFGALSPRVAELVWGASCNVVLLAFFSSPLSTLAHVLCARNSASIAANWPLTAASLANAALWTAYGLAIGRPFVWAPNAAGVALGVVQLALIAVLPSRPLAAGDASRPSGSDDAESPRKGVDSTTPVALDLRVTSTGKEAASPTTAAAGAAERGAALDRDASWNRSSRGLLQ